jgi:hypothetical protein
MVQLFRQSGQPCKDCFSTESDPSISSVGREEKLEVILQHNSGNHHVKVKGRQICGAKADFLFPPCESQRVLNMMETVL